MIYFVQTNIQAPDSTPIQYNTDTLPPVGNMYIFGFDSNSFHTGIVDDNGTDTGAMFNKIDIKNMSDDVTANTAPSSNDEMSTDDVMQAGGAARNKVAEKWIRKLQNRKHRKTNTRPGHSIPGPRPAAIQR